MSTTTERRTENARTFLDEGHTMNIYGVEQNQSASAMGTDQALVLKALAGAHG